ncbi:NACHT domain-containing NTPase [Dyadobacter sp. NIV53]|uniref:NACHT domain-containing protein n=1 Tax=Dyadobacter sp. NIV53 TaxID=2861765 RepID=UPI001C866FDE|nr:NACHT domain-containing protein [Dyadobacter sp. NIV53]
MVVLGEPGMGKSTTMQYMAYNDAKDLLSTNSNNITRIPIYLELKLFSKSETIIEVASHKVGIEEERLLDYFTKGKITLFLDGLNEVFIEIRKSIRIEIQKLIAKYPKLAIIVTTRPLAYANEFKETPVFVLQRMEDEQVKEFLLKNCSHVPTRALIFNEVTANIRLGKIVRVPLLLKMLINVVLNNKGIIPANKTLIIKRFIQNLYDRETKKITSDIDFRIIHRLLCFVGYKTRNINGSNVGWRMEELEAIIERRIEGSRFKINAYEFLDYAMDLNIIVNDENKYSFIHELYQEYYASEEMFRESAVIK